MTSKVKYGLSDTQLTFVDAYSDSGDVTQAAKAAGFTRQRGHQLIKEPKIIAAIEAKNREKLQSGAVKALGVVEHLMDNAQSETTKLKAAVDWLDRAGYKPEHNWRNPDESDRDADIDYIRSRIKQLTNELGIDIEEAEVLTQSGDEPTHPPDRRLSHEPDEGQSEGHEPDAPEETPLPGGEGRLPA